MDRTILSLGFKLLRRSGIPEWIIDRFSLYFEGYEKIFKIVKELADKYWQSASSYFA